MNDLLFYLTILALLYYFFIYQPSPKPLPQPLTHSQSTQTDPDLSPINLPGPQFEEDSELEATLDFLIKGMSELTHAIK